MFACFSVVASTPVDVDPHVAPRSPTQLLDPFQKCQMARLRADRVCAYPFQETDQANSLAWLRTRRERPCRCAAKQCDEIASPQGRPSKQTTVPYHAGGCIVHHGKLEQPMSALGQKRTLCGVRSMSALPPKADIGTQSRN